MSSADCTRMMYFPSCLLTPLIARWFRYLLAPKSGSAVKSGSTTLPSFSAPILLLPPSPYTFHNHSSNCLKYTLDELYITSHNHHTDGTEEISVRGYEARSMSVGDVVHFLSRSEWYVCDSAGWRAVTEGFAYQYS